MNELGTYIKEKRTAKGLSIRRLAELADISHTEVKRIEDGLRKQTSPQVLRSIASALGVPYGVIPLFCHNYDFFLMYVLYLCTFCEFS